eukprot:8028540-Lingulodinium_polyedra.AAC.1
MPSLSTCAPVKASAAHSTSQSTIGQSSGTGPTFATKAAWRTRTWSLTSLTARSATPLAR